MAYFKVTEIKENSQVNSRASMVTQIIWSLCLNKLPVFSFCKQE